MDRQSHKTLVLFTALVSAIPFSISLIASPWFEFPDRLSVSPQFLIDAFAILGDAGCIVLALTVSAVTVMSKEWKLLLVSLLCLSLSIGTMFTRQLWPYMWDVRYLTFPGKYAECERKANSSPSNIGFEYCAVFLEPGGFINYIVYDKTGEIVKPPNLRSLEWVQRVVCDHNGAMGVNFDPVPLGYGFYKISNPGGDEPSCLEK